MVQRLLPSPGAGIYSQLVQDLLFSPCASGGTTATAQPGCWYIFTVSIRVIAQPMCW